MIKAWAFMAAHGFIMTSKKPKNGLIIHSDQGSQFGSDEFARWCKNHR
jgi:transposase InsO family protein